MHHSFVVFEALPCQHPRRPDRMVYAFVIADSVGLLENQPYTRLSLAPQSTIMGLVAGQYMLSGFLGADIFLTLWCCSQSLVGALYCGNAGTHPFKPATRDKALVNSIVLCS